MMRVLIAVFSLCLLSVAHGQQAETSSGAHRAAPTFGGVTTQSIEAEGVGQSVEQATLRALDAAISQVNGRHVKSSHTSNAASISIDINGLRRFDASSSAFAEHIISCSNGAVRSFQVLSTEEITRTEAESSLDFRAKGDTPWVEGFEASLNA